MTSLRFLSVGCSLILLAAGLSLPDGAAESVSGNSTVTLTEEEVMTGGNATPEAAASNMILACATRDYELFSQNRYYHPSACSGKKGGPNRYAYFLHTTKFTSGQSDFTVYDLPQRLKPNSVRAMFTQVFASNPNFYRMSFWSKQYRCVDVVSANYEGHEYRSRILVGKLSNDKWYAIPRHYSSLPLYEVADAMRSATLEAVSK